MRTERTRERVPGTKALLGIGIDGGQAHALRRLLLLPVARTSVFEFVDGNPWTELPKTKAWLDKCHGMPSATAMKLAAADEIIGGFGVECFWGRGGQDARPRPALEYVNLGDTYCVTLCRYRGLSGRGRWLVTSWGDVVEAHPRVFGDE